ncbi:MAG TPA: mannitol-1-phosphate 5-dehydrogenase [Armatimonadetes bacterium]|nr:mannitol-1-phosphate 5-dehydrogenase [Armatimonadota bacterium]
MMKLLQFGAGNIGRGFIAQIFAHAGYEVVFVDIDDVLVRELNRQHRYRIEVKDASPQTLWVEGVRAVHFNDRDIVVKEISTADIAATAVGAQALPSLYPVIADGLVERWRSGGGPLDIIICENLRNAAEIVRRGLQEHVPPNFPLDEMVGLVETSIGRMIPLMPDEVRRAEPLLIYAEAYNTLIVDKKGFKNPVPAVPQIDAKENMKAYVDRKLFIHNLGHSATAYIGYVTDPKMVYIWQAVEHEDVRPLVERVMWESGHALIAEYPDEFNEVNQQEHIDDLLRRFANRALGDTIHRVGRDLLRKLGPNERLIGALRLDLKHGIEPDATIHAIAAALLFRATDDKGQLYPRDEEFVKVWYPKGVEAILTEISHLDLDNPLHRTVIQRVKESHDRLAIMRK